MDTYERAKLWLKENRERHHSAHMTSDQIALGAFCGGYDEASSWISVEDRLPEQNVVSLVYLKGKEFMTAFRCRSFYGEVWAAHDLNEEYRLRDVTHWMPLPSPPKGE